MVALLEYEKAFERAALTVAWLDEKRVGVWVDAKVVPRVFWMVEQKATPRAVSSASQKVDCLEILMVDTMDVVSVVSLVAESVVLKVVEMVSHLVV